MQDARNGRRALGLGLASLLIGGGCHKFVPVETGQDLDRTTYVRASLEEPRSFRLADISPNAIRVVEGEVIGWRGDSLGLSAFLMTGPSGEFLPRGQTVMIGRGELASLEAKRLDGIRTAAAVGGLVALGSATGIALTSGGSEGEAGDGGGGEPQ
ncbi:MAG: hypothetical protein ACREMK_10210 [Gemmatimonadota bacterium]